MRKMEPHAEQKNIENGAISSKITRLDCTWGPKWQLKVPSWALVAVQREFRSIFLVKLSVFLPFVFFCFFLLLCCRWPSKARPLCCTRHERHVDIFRSKKLQ